MVCIRQRQKIRCRNETEIRKPFINGESVMKAYEKLFVFLTWLCLAFAVFVFSIMSPIVSALVAAPVFLIVAIPFSAIVFGGLIFE